MDNIDKLFTIHSQALALKELGFNEPCIAVFSEKGELSPITNLKPCNSNVPSYATAPIKSQVFEWGRKQGYDTKVQKESEGLYFGFYWNGASWVIVGEGSYEESESACVDKIIEIVKNKQNG